MGALPKPTEKQIETSILEFLEAKRIFAWKNSSVGIFDPTKGVFRKSNNRFAINGVADILGVFEGKFLAIEVKTPTNKTRTDSQNYFIKSINEAGGVAFYATSIDDVKMKLGL